MHHDCHIFSMSMLIFIEDNKRNECGGSFLENLKKIIKFLHSFIGYFMNDMILNHVNSNMIFPKPHEILKHRVHYTFTCLESHGKSNLKCYVEEVVESMKLWI